MKRGFELVLAIYTLLILLGWTEAGKGLAVIVNARLFHYEVVTFLADHLNHLGYPMEIWLLEDISKDRVMGTAGLAFLKEYSTKFRFIPNDLAHPHAHKHVPHAHAHTSHTTHRAHLSGRNALSTDTAPPAAQGAGKASPAATQDRRLASPPAAPTITPAIPFAMPTVPIKLLVIVNSDENSDIPFLCRLHLYWQLRETAERVLMVVHHGGNVARIAPYCEPPHCSLLVLGEHIRDSMLQQLSHLQYLQVNVLTAYGVFQLSAAHRKRSEAIRRHFLGLSNSTIQKPVRLLVIQGSLRHNRRRYKELFACVNKMLSSGKRLRVALVGQVVRSDPIGIPEELKKHIVVYANREFSEYYPIVASSDGLVTFANEEFAYLGNRSTSSVTISTVCEVPMAIPKSLLMIYPCLREQALHRQVTADNDCEAMENVLRLSDEEYKRMQSEVKYCKKVWAFEGRAMLQEFLEKPMPKNATLVNSIHSHCTGPLIRALKGQGV